MDGGLQLMPTRNPYYERLDEAFSAQRDILAEQRQLAKDRYEAGRRRIEEMRLTPSRSEQLMQISQALLSPSPYRNRFAGTLANLSQVAGPMLGARRRAEIERANMLRELTEQYEDRMLTSRQGEASLLTAQAKALEPNLQLSPQTGEIVDLNTGQSFQPSPATVRPPQEALAEFAEYYNNPEVTEAQRQEVVQNFQKTFGVSPFKFFERRP